VLDAYGFWKLTRRGHDRRERALLRHAVTAGDKERERLLHTLDVARTALDELYDRREEMTPADWEDVAELADEIEAFIVEAKRQK
jgi:hypothetical protein